MRLLIAFSVGAALFAALPVIAYPVAAEGDDLGRSFLLGFGGAAAIGAAVVLVAGRPLAAVLGGFLCPLVGSLVYAALVLVPRFGSGLSPALVWLTFPQFLPSAALGALSGLAVLALSARLGRRGGDARTS